MSASLSTRGEVAGVWSEGSIGLVMTTWQEQSAQGETLPYCWPQGAFRLVADVRLSQREALHQALQTHQVPVRDTSDVGLLAAAYALWAERCVEHLHGEFAFVVWDEQRQSLFAARSPMGLRPLVYHRTASRFLCASEPRHLLTDPTVARDLDEDWMVLWLTEGIDSWKRTPFRDIQELVPGHTLLVDAQGIHITPFWSPCPRVLNQYSSQQEAIEQFRHLLFRVVQEQMQSEHPVLVDLSGGLDSSSLVCIARTLSKQEHPFPPLTALHVSSSRYREVDDRAFARLVAQRYGVALEPLSYDALPAFEGACDPRQWTSTPTIPTLFFTRLYQQQWQIARTLGARPCARRFWGSTLLCLTQLSHHLLERAPPG